MAMYSRTAAIHVALCVNTAESVLPWNGNHQTAQAHVTSVGGAFTHPSRGAGQSRGTPTGGVRFARPPANVCDPYRGRRVVSATSSPDDIAATRTAVSGVSARWVPIHHKPFRGNKFTVHPKLPWRGFRNEPGVERSVQARASTGPPFKHGATLCLGFCLGFESAVSVGGVLGLLNELNSDSL